MKKEGKEHQLPTRIVHNNKIYREMGFSYADCKAYKRDDHVILVEQDGSVFFSYNQENNHSREM